MPFIAFLGCDGSGKSAVIEQLANRLEATGKKVHRGHWRPRPFSNRPSSSAGAEDPHGKSVRGTGSSILKLGWLWFNWWAAWFRSLGTQCRNGYVIFDRFHGDLLVDPARYRYGAPLWIAKCVCRLMPQPDLVVFLDAPPDILLSRKQEVGIEALTQARESYLRFCDTQSRCKVVDASRPLQDVVAEAELLVSELHLKS